MSFIQRVWKDTEPVIRHTIGVAVTILAMHGMSYWLKLNLESDAKLFDLLP